MAPRDQFPHLDDRKVLDIEELSAALEQMRADGLTIVHCHGVFDLVHPGHILHLEAARREGDVLVVSITADHFVNKGPGRPVFNAQLRAETLAALQSVRFVTINEAPDATRLIARIKPDVYVKGSDYVDEETDVTGKISEETNAVEKGGGRVHFTNEMTMSSSELLNQHFDVFTPETRGWLSQIKAGFSGGEIETSLDKVRDCKVLVVGEAIIDEYYFCEGLGKSAKDPILAFKYCSQETYIGGSLGVANHLSGICDNVGIVSLVGDSDNRTQFIRERLHPNVNFYPFGRTGAPTIHKRRYVDNHTGGKVFELYTLEDTPLDATSEEKLIGVLDGAIDDYDLVVVTDYGHGMMTPRVIEFLQGRAKFLAVNTQANAGNRGFNTISKYPKADYACLNGGEVQLDMRTRQGNFRDMVTKLAARMDCSKFTVTLGQLGSLHYDPDSGFVEAPALAIRIADRVGAGDAVLSITSPLVATGAPWELVAFLANLAGAQAVAELGTSRAIDRASLIKHAQSILK